ncbi:MAG: alpha/beta hydrolase [Nitrososphaeraceae archaeon]
MLSNKNGIILLIMILILSLLYSINLSTFHNIYASTDSIADTTSEKSIPIYMITTRGDLNPTVEVQGDGYNGKYQFGDINQLKKECPAEIAIFVHGWGNNEFKAKERLDRIKMSLENNSYGNPLIGLSWDSNKDWGLAKNIAKNNGPKLANFIIEYVDTCKQQHKKDTNIRLISHSLGARVLLSTLDYLNTNSTWNNNDYKIASMHLLGAAVDNEEVSKNPLDIDGDSNIKHAYGKAIQEEVIRFYNLYNPEDNMLQPKPFKPDNYIYEVYPSPAFENDLALGQNGKDTTIATQDQVSTPPYYELNVQNQIPAISNADAMEDKHSLLCFSSSGICEFTKKGSYDYGLCGGFIWDPICRVGIGDNHGGYIGFRNLDNVNLLEDDGAMNIVVKNWRNP